MKLTEDELIPPPDDPRGEFKEDSIYYIINGSNSYLFIDMVRLAASNRIEKAILVTGDSDLVPAIKAVQDLNVLVELIYHPRSIGDDLYQTARDRTRITQEMIDACLR